MSNEKTVLDRLDDMIDELVILRQDIEKAIIEAANTPTGEVPEDLYDPEKERISMLVSGTPNLYLVNPEQYEKMAPYADPNKPPFTTQGWFLTAYYGKDVRLPIGAELPSNPRKPWDDLRKDADS